MPEKQLKVESEYPRKIALVVKNGFQRLRRYRRARAMFIKQFVGQYYASSKGITGDEPINLIFHAIRTLVPNLVMKNPVTDVTTDDVRQDDYAFLLGLALDSIDKKIKLKTILRGGIVAALFAMGIFKTGIAASGQVLTWGDFQVDPGQVYSDLVDLDDFVIDPSCRAFDKAAFLGDRNRVPRQLLLDDNNCDHDLVMRLPRSTHPDAKNKIEKLTQSNLSNIEIFELQDFVDVVELFVPEANTNLLIPDPEVIIFDDYIKAVDFYGPSEGPYTTLSLTPPVPGNPYPVAPVGIWHDLHVMANRSMVKSMEQADRQKDIGIYDPAGADEAEDIRTSRDGDMVAGQPDSVKVVSFGGQNRDNASMLSQMQIWFNYMSGNPDQMAGLKSDARTATQAQMLQANANVTIEDMRDMIYDVAAELNKKMAWYLHTDPLIDLPLTKRRPGGERTQLRLTPEQRSGDFLNFAFDIKARSMSRLDPAIKSKRIIEFATNVIPSLMTSLQIATQAGVPFNAMRVLTDLAKELDITDTAKDWFDDPEFMNRIQLMMAMGPQNAGKAGMGSPQGIRQQGGYPGQKKVSSPQREQNQGFQMGANESQAANQGVY